MILRWSGPARRDLAAIYVRIAESNPNAAFDMDALFRTRALDLADHPMLGKAGRVDGTRELVVHPSYVLVYDIAAATVRILRVLHTSQQWPSP